MRIHHLNCATFCPYGGKFIDGMTFGIGAAQIVCHVLLIETERGLILIDTGLGTHDIESKKNFSYLKQKILRPRFDYEETALAQILKLGYQAQDVRHIILTHLDFDHAGGVEDFPHADVHVMHAERKAALERKTKLDFLRYEPRHLKRAHHWYSYFPEGERWFGFQSVRDLEGLPPEILFVPLIGHTAGHAGVAIQTDQGWLLHAGDAYFSHSELDKKCHCPLSIKLYQHFMDTNHEERLKNLHRLRELSANHAYDVTIFSSHDPLEFMALKDGVSRSLYQKDHELIGLGLT